jgi:two-component system LytT family response regulator
METVNVNYPGYAACAKTPVIILPTCKGTMAIPVQQIIRIQSISNYSKLFLNNGRTLVVAKVLHFFEEHPLLYSFVRIHRTHLVNLNFIKTYHSAKTGVLLLHNGETVTVAKRKKAVLAERLHSVNNCLSAQQPYISL